MASIFLSYRRADSAGYAGRLAEDLQRQFGEDSIFQDIEAIPAGSNFVQVIDEAIARCRVLVVLIGDTWMTERGPDGQRRIDHPGDFVRLEIAAALRKGTRILPVLVEGTRMPTGDDLPDDLRPLSRLQALELSDSRWEYDVKRLVQAIVALTGEEGTKPTRSRLLISLSVGIGVIALAAVLFLFIAGTKDVSGRWNLPNGSYWMVAQEGRRLSIEEVHYESKQVWKRGKGKIDRNTVAFSLDLVYSGLYQYEGELTLSADGSSLSGKIRDINLHDNTTRSEAPLSLSRAP